MTASPLSVPSPSLACLLLFFSDTPLPRFGVVIAVSGMCSLVSHFCAFAYTPPSAWNVPLFKVLKNLLIFLRGSAHLLLLPPPQTSSFPTRPFSVCPASMIVALTLKCQLFICLSHSRLACGFLSGYRLDVFSTFVSWDGEGSG